VGGSRRCPLPASLEGVGVGPRWTNRAGQSPVPGTDPPERNRRAKSRTADPPKVAPQDPRGARPGRRDRLPRNTPTFIVGRAGEGGTEAGKGPGLTWATPTPRDASRGGRQRRARSGLGRGPTTPGPCPGWRARWLPASQSAVYRSGRPEQAALASRGAGPTRPGTRRWQVQDWRVSPAQ
jgi:hypothetical protein